MAVQIDPNFLKSAQKSLPGIAQRSITAVLELAAEGATVPFMARYRKEKTGNLDEVQIRNVIEANENWQELVKRKAFVLEEIEKQASLTSDLKAQIDRAEYLAEVEEIYRPFKKKKKTKAKLAQEAGLSPLADWIWNLGQGTVTDAASLEVKAKDFINAEKQFATYEEVLRGAQHIIVEKLANNPDLRAAVKEDYFAHGVIVSEKTKDFKVHSKYAMYAEFSEPVKTLQAKKASHRYLAIRRGWTEGELKVSIKGSDEALQRKFDQLGVPKPGSQATEFLKLSAKTAFEVHVVPSVTNELHTFLKEAADKHAIEVFAENVRNVLMSSPFGAKVVLALDPGLRTGCKVALVDSSGRFISHTVMQILGEGAAAAGKKLFDETLKQIKIDAIAVGNGTAGRETETFVRKILKDIGKEDVPVILVNESGASVYSASDVAREEFPELDVTVRGAISIARRLQDPLSELVKIDPKSIGVGQYQHDVNQGQLKKSLHDVVESCVNQVGVDLNTASSSLLQYVSGIGPGIAKNIVEHRTAKGLFTERSELLNIPHFSSKVFEQAAGFLRVRGGKVALDATGIHPERYSAVRDMLSEADLTLAKAVGGDVTPLKNMREKWVALVGEYTFDDIVTELAKPSRDPRDPFKVFQFRDDIHELKDLKEAMICPGIVTNVTNFGAFVDIGVHQDGLVHISHLSHSFVADPREVVAPGMQVQVKVLTVDLEKKQIALTMLLEEKPKAVPREQAGGKQPREARAKRSEPKQRPAPPKDPRQQERSGVAIQLRDKNAPPVPTEADGRPKRDERPRRDDARAGGRDERPRSQERSGQPIKPRTPSSPFNNPFAALTNVKK